MLLNLPQKSSAKRAAQLSMCSESAMLKASDAGTAPTLATRGSAKRSAKDTSSPSNLSAPVVSGRKKKSVAKSGSASDGASVLKKPQKKSQSDERSTGRCSGVSKAAARAGASKKSKAGVATTAAQDAMYLDDAALDPECENHSSTGSSASSDGEEEEDAELSVQMYDRVFCKPNQRSGAFSVAADHAAAGGQESEWTQTQLERKIAAIVQMYDPVTCEVVTKKLGDLGFKPKTSSMFSTGQRSSDTRSVVESILRSFHDRQLIMYDNGIAYSL